MFTKLPPSDSIYQISPTVRQVYTITFSVWRNNNSKMFLLGRLARILQLVFFFFNFGPLSQICSALPSRLSHSVHFILFTSFRGFDPTSEENSNRRTDLNRMPLVVKKILSLHITDTSSVFNHWCGDDRHWLLSSNPEVLSSSVDIANGSASSFFRSYKMTDATCIIILSHIANYASSSVTGLFFRNEEGAADFLHSVRYSFDKPRPPAATLMTNTRIKHNNHHPFPGMSFAEQSHHILSSLAALADDHSSQDAELPWGSTCQRGRWLWRQKQQQQQRW